MGTYRAHAILTRMAENKGKSEDLAELKSLSENMLLASFCGLGQSVPIPIDSALLHFEGHFKKATTNSPCKSEKALATLFLSQ